MSDELKTLKIDGARHDFWRGFIGDVDKYDILLLHDFEKKEINSKVSLYESIGELAGKMDHPLFVPGRYVKYPGDKDELPPESIETILSEIMLPQVRLVLIYLGIAPSNLEFIDHSMKTLGKDIVYFFEEKAKIPSAGKVFGSNRDITIPRGMSKEPFFKFFQDAPYSSVRSYNKIRGVVKFLSIEDCLEQMREVFENYFWR